MPIPKGPNDGLHFHGCVGKNHLLICGFFVCDCPLCASCFFVNVLRLLCNRTSLFSSACFSNENLESIGTTWLFVAFNDAGFPVF